uniref:PGG domain-containing protein n=1 Tax=Oryza rufipogon TaxID=4529 RepID=A0A0E0Q9A7_ORYRU
MLFESTVTTGHFTIPSNRRDPRVLVHNCLCWVRAPLSLNHRAAHIIVDEPAPALDDEEDYMTRNGTIGSVLIATVAFAAAFTVPGGFIADDRPHAGTAILASRFAFRAFVVTDTMAFLCSIVATSFLIYGSAKEIPRGHRWWYSLLASGLVPWGAQFLIGTFALGFHLVLGSANRGLVIFVYMSSSVSRASGVHSVLGFGKRYGDEQGGEDSSTYTIDRRAY